MSVKLFEKQIIAKIDSGACRTCVKSGLIPLERVRNTQVSLNSASG